MLTRYENKNSDKNISKKLNIDFKIEKTREAKRYERTSKINYNDSSKKCTKEIVPNGNNLYQKTRISKTENRKEFQRQ